MTKSSTKELFTPFKNLKREFRSSRKLFKTLSRDKSGSPVFDLFSDLEENSEEEEVILFYNGLEVPTRQILDSKGAIPTKRDADAKVVIQEMAEFSQKWHNGTSKARNTKTSDGLEAIQAQLINLGRELKKVNEKVYTAQNRKLIFKSRQATIPFPSRLNDYCCDEERSYVLQCLDAYSYRATRIDDSIPRKEKDPRSFTLPCYINNVCFENALADLDKTVKHPKGIAENVLVWIGKFIFPIDFIILDMPEDVKVPLILERPFLSTAHANIDVFKRNIFFRRDQVDDLMPTIEEGEIVDKPMIDKVKIRNDNKMVSKIIGYPSDYDQDEKICIDYAYNLKFSCMIVVEDMDPYLDEGIGEVVVGEPFYEVSCVETRKFDGIITIHNEDDNVTY
nr:hypothetical protein [Tanacetum cinerariifolium]